MSAQTARLASTPSPLGRPGGPGLYHIKGLSHSPYFQHIVKALIRSGHPPGEAYAMAWGAIRRWARGGKNVHPEVRAAAAAALAQETAARGVAHSHAAPESVSALELTGTSAGAAKHHRAPSGHPHGGGRFMKKPQTQVRQRLGKALKTELAKPAPDKVKVAKLRNALAS